MCQMLKYYETEESIYILLDFYHLGKLYNYLDWFYENKETFFNELNQIHTLTESTTDEHAINNTLDESLDNISSRRISSTRRCASLQRANSLTSLKSPHFNSNSNSTPNFFSSKRRTQSYISSVDTCQHIQKDIKLTEVELSKIQMNDDEKQNQAAQVVFSPNTSPSSSSSRSLISSESTAQQQDTLNQSKNESDDIYAKREENDKENRSKLVIESSSTYLNQVRIWLAQIYLAIKNLHQIGIVLRDLNADNVLFSSKNNNACLTFMSRWNLTDDKLNYEAKFYLAPGNS
jgi:hypothetical protein